MISSQTRAGPTRVTFPDFRSRVFFLPLRRLVKPNQDGERGERLTNTLFGAKIGGHDHR